MASIFFIDSLGQGFSEAIKNQVYVNRPAAKLALLKVKFAVALLFWYHTPPAYPIGGILAEMRLFVCGSLMDQQVHYQKIKSYVKSKVEASIPGALYRLEVGYPAIIDQGSGSVLGQVLELEGPDLLMQLLDEFHGVSQLKPERSLHFRVSKTATLSDNSQAAVQVYVLNPTKLPRRAELIADGDWLSDVAKRPILPQKLSDRQVTYIKKLAESKGREIVPIDLQLYRELMNLDLIVDKGRRLALTKLGKEVHRHLPQ